MKVDPGRLAGLIVPYRPLSFLRVTPTRHRATPLGTGYGATRFASPTDAFTLLYIAADLATAVAETLIRDRFEGRIRRRIVRAEAEGWGVTEVSATAPLALLDLRTTGLLRLGVSTNTGRAKSQRRGRAFSQVVYDRTTADGILYTSRLTNAVCCAVYGRGVGKLTAGMVEDIVTLTSFVPALESLDIALVASP